MPSDARAAYARLGEGGGRGGLLAGLLLGVDHVGIAVSSIDEAGAGWAALLGRPLVDREAVHVQKTEVGFLRMPGGGSAVELICPLPGNAGLEKFVDSRGDAFHHLALAVSDIRAALDRLAVAGIELIDHAPRPGAGGHLVAFLHPRALGGSLVELVERH